MRAAFLVVVCSFGTLLLTNQNAAASKLPQTFKTCLYNDPDLDRCLRNAVQDAVSQLTKPLPDLKVPSLEPLLVSHIRLAMGSGQVQVRQHYWDIEYHGLTSMQLKKIKFDLEGRKFELEAMVPDLMQKSKYEMDGKILVLPIQGKGDCVVEMKNVEAVAHAEFDIQPRNGIYYGNVTGLVLHLTPQSVSFDFQNLFNGDKAMADNILGVLNDNWRLILDEVMPEYEKALTSVLLGLANKFFNAIPMTEIFADYKP